MIPPPSKPPGEWRRTRHLADALALARFLDGTRTTPEAARAAGLPNEGGAYRILATLRHLAEERPDLVSVKTRQDGRTVYHRVTLLPAADEADKTGP